MSSQFDFGILAVAGSGRRGVAATVVVVATVVVAAPRWHEGYGWHFAK